METGTEKQTQKRIPDLLRSKVLQIRPHSVTDALVHTDDAIAGCHSHFTRRGVKKPALAKKRHDIVHTCSEGRKHSSQKPDPIRAKCRQKQRKAKQQQLFDHDKTRPATRAKARAWPRTKRWKLGAAKTFNEHDGSVDASERHLHGCLFVLEWAQAGGCNILAADFRVSSLIANNEWARRVSRGNKNQSSGCALAKRYESQCMTLTRTHARTHQ